ncbi:MTH1187 family thiamine-binding protein [Anaerobacillus sp. MEB173]|uniref:MTH1187 family thiamine-binding protein n=1 Tax=Anaerobacillus sp. MEB173 TaxID=3383345 RepID=UPI003F91A3DD
MIRGLSYQKGVFFIGKRNIACAYDKNGKIVEWVLPLSIKSILKVFSQVLFSMPIGFLLFTIIFFSCIFVPKWFDFGWDGFPYYFVFYYMFGTHFIFPAQLRKYHGAEHKVFSYNGIKSLGYLKRIQKAAITNKHCSTNTVVIYFSSVVLLAIMFSMYKSNADAVQWASYSALGMTMVINFVLHKKGCRWLTAYVLSVSYFLQKHVTTSEPDHVHMKTAIRSYRCLAKVEFPERLKFSKKREVKNMAIVDITIIPIGTKTASVSEYVADIHRVLQTYNDKVTYQLTPMSTIIEGELPVLFEIIQALHEVPFKAGVDRVATNIRIDDRRDKQLKMDEKLKSVEEKLLMDDYH